MSEPWIEPAAWSQQPAVEAARFEVVYDEDLGCIVQLSAPDGSLHFGTDTP